LDVRGVPVFVNKGRALICLQSLASWAAFDVLLLTLGAAVMEMSTLIQGTQAELKDVEALNRHRTALLGTSINNNQRLVCSTGSAQSSNVLFNYERPPCLVVEFALLPGYWLLLAGVMAFYYSYFVALNLHALDVEKAKLHVEIDRKHTKQRGKAGQVTFVEMK